MPVLDSPRLRSTRGYTLIMQDAEASQSIDISRLRSLLTARCIAIFGLTLMLFLLLSRGVEEAPGNGFLVSLGLLTLVTVASLMRLASSWQVTELEYLVQLTIDVGGFAALLYFSGGAYNPAVAYLLVPIALATQVLTPTFARSIAIIGALAIMTLIFLHEPIPPFSPSPAPAQVLVVGWSALLVCALTLGWFGVEIAEAGRRAAALAAKKDNADNRDIAAVVRLAAGTAEELGAPLATMSSLVEELAHMATDTRHRDDFQLLAEQLDHCRLVLDKLSRTARVNESGEKRWVELLGFAEATVRHWLSQRPHVEAEVTVSGEGDSPRLQADYALAHALEHLLDNAAEVSPKPIRVDVSWDDSHGCLSVMDGGPGFPEELLGGSDKVVVSPGKKGLGVGLLISHATISRYNGQLELTNRKEGGATARIRLPINV